MTDEPNYDSKTMQPRMEDDPIASPTKDQISGNTVMQKIRSLIDNYLGWSKQITDKVNSLEPGGGSGKTYTAGDGIDISEDDVISNTDHAQTQTNTSDIASIRVSMSDLASSAALGAETEARKSVDSILQANIDKKQDKLSAAQQSALDSGITSTKVQKYDAYADVKQNTLSQAQLNAVNSGITAAKVNSYNTDISQLKISDAEHTTTLADQAKQLSSQATEITAIKSKDATQDSSISALQTKTATHDTEIQGLSESVVSDLTGTFTDSTRTLKLSLERESAEPIDCSVVIPAGGSGSAGVTSFNTNTGDIKQRILTNLSVGASASRVSIDAVYQTEEGKSSTVGNELDAVSDKFAGIVTPAQKAGWDAKADASTVTQIQTAVGECFNDASVSGNSLILSTVGGQQNTLTLPGGGGGASLPENGYYWEKIVVDAGTWVTEGWDTTIGIYCPMKYKLDPSTSTWTESMSMYAPDDYAGMGFCYSDKSIIPYYISNIGIDEPICINFAVLKKPFSSWNTTNYDLMVISLECIAFNSAGSLKDNIGTMTISDIMNMHYESTTSIYRLRKFS